MGKFPVLPHLCKSLQPRMFLPLSYQVFALEATSLAGSPKYDFVSHLFSVIQLSGSLSGFQLQVRHEVQVYKKK